MRIDSCRDDLPPQSAPPVRCEIDERVDTTPATCRKCSKECATAVAFEGILFCTTCIKFVTWMEAMHLKFCGDECVCKKASQ
jgi:hypothetical protein